MGEIVFGTAVVPARERIAVLFGNNRCHRLATVFHNLKCVTLAVVYKYHSRFLDTSWVDIVVEHTAVDFTGTVDRTPKGSGGTACAVNYGKIVGQGYLASYRAAVGVKGTTVTDGCFGQRDTAIQHTT